jgi:prolyl-tRNA synthetase
MIQLSRFPVKTLKTQPKISDNRSTSLLLQAWFIRQEMAGVYDFLPLGLRVLRKIENIVREEMDRAWYSEVLMSILTPKELWDTTNRWEIPEYFKVPAWGTSEYRISPTNEENVVPLMKEFIESYKDLPLCVYHIQKKFRNEKRAKSGLLRGREFIMKDAYSFHSNNEDFVKFYEDAKKAYMRVFTRLGLGSDTVIAQADGGVFTDKFSHEFQTFLEIWEDIIVQDISGYCANLEVADWIPDNKNISESEKAMEIFESVDDIVNMEKMTSYFWAPDWQMLKTVVYKTISGKFFWIIVRWDLQVNEIKVRKFISEKYGEKFTLATEEDLVNLGTVRWFVSPLKISHLNIDFYGDESLKTVKNFFWGANAIAKSSKNVNIGDLDIKAFGDFNEPVEGFLSKNTWEKLTFRRACEVGNIFPLETKFTRPFKVAFLGEDNKMNDNVLMGCYGIGVSRLMWVVAEYFTSEKGINWPENLAPATHYIIVLGNQGEKALEIAQKLELEGNEVIFDDRGGKVGFGQKMGDAELYGIPNIIIISDKTVEKGWYELKKRWDEEAQFVSF